MMKHKNTLALLVALALLLALCTACAPRRRESSEAPANSQDGGMALNQNVDVPLSSPAPAPPSPEISGGGSSSEDTSGIPGGEEIQPASAALQSGDFSALRNLDGETKGWGSGGGGFDELGRPVGPVAFQEQFAKYGAWFLQPPDTKSIYLTFDEGYENGHTPSILDTLKAENVKAVFFVTGDFAKNQPELMRRILDEGHVLGNHSMRHKIYPDIPLEEAAKDLLELHDLVRETYGYEMKLFRFPEGKYSERTLALVQQLGYQPVFWSFAYRDYDVNDQPGYIEALDRITRNPHPGGIYLLHAVSRTNADALREVIEVLRDQEGYTLAQWPPR